MEDILAKWNKAKSRFDVLWVKYLQNKFQQFFDDVLFYEITSSDLNISLKNYLFFKNYVTTK